MKEYIHPQSLKHGDKAIIISPSGHADPINIDKSKSMLESWGLNVILSEHSKGEYGRYAGTVSERLFDLQSAMNDKDIKLIFCSRGGYGIVQLLESLDFHEIIRYPKWLVGYSDITALHWAFLHNGIASLHAPMSSHLAEEGEDVASIFLQEILFSKKQTYSINSHPLNRSGKINGRLFGGNLTVFTGLMGSQYAQIPENSILFIEDIAESPYKIDRMMWNLQLSGILSSISGLIVGHFTNCEEDPLMKKTIYESIRQIVDKYDFPVAFDFPVGHIKNNYPLVHGGEYLFEVNKKNVLLTNVG
ncbi:MAG: LD-carboxypeptidase [Dysgonomonas sp.]